MDRIIFMSFIPFNGWWKAFTSDTAMKDGCLANYGRYISWGAVKDVRDGLFVILNLKNISTLDH